MRLQQHKAFSRLAVRRCSWAVILLMLGRLAAAAHADESGPFPIPEKTMWRVTASSEVGEFTAGLVCDGKPDTRWGSADLDSQWLQFDFGSCATLCGVTLHWEAAYGQAYRVETAMNPSEWTPVYETTHGVGGTEEIYFAPVNARYMRLLLLKRATKWGYSLWEVDVQGERQAPQVASGDKPSLWHPIRNWKQAWSEGDGQSQNVIVDLRRARALAGVRVGWGDVIPIQAHLSVSPDCENWHDVGEISQDTFDASLSGVSLDTRYLRLRLASPSPQSPVFLRELALLRPARETALLLRYSRAATRAPAGLYPDFMQHRQTYWTVVGLPGDTQDSLLDEYGAIEPIAGGSSITPFLYLKGHLFSALDEDTRVESGLEDDALPLPWVTWELPDVRLKVETMIQGGAVTDSVNIASYTVINMSTNCAVSGELFLTVRPIQVNPPWQRGGLSPIRELVFVPNGSNLIVRVNGHDSYIALNMPDDMGACPYDEGDIAEFIRHDVLPSATDVVNSLEHVSGALRYRFDLPPGGKRQVLCAMPLHETPHALAAFSQDDAGHPLNSSQAFNALRQKRIQMWHTILDRTHIQLPDQDLCNMIHAMTGWILVNCDGAALDPGPRNYKRVWMRDGSLISAALLRMGQTETVRDFLDWYAARVQPNGRVPPVLNPDGSIYQGLGENTEYDSQGEFVFAIMEYYRFTHDRAFLQRHFDEIQRALHYLELLRAQTLREDYCEGNFMRARFIGLLPPSISHEGYSTPVHSYWDDLFALKGWKDGRAAASILERADVVSWTTSQYEALRDSVRASLLRTIGESAIDYVPGCAEKADRDPSSTSIAFFPCEERDLFPGQAVDATYENYYAELVRRMSPTWTGVSTPYEARNIQAFVQLNAPARAQFLLRLLVGGRRPKSWHTLAEVLPANARQGIYIGDVPHSWGQADLLIAIRSLLVAESGDRLVLMAGIPESWVNESDGIRLVQLPTYFGPIDLVAREQNHTLTMTLGGDIHAPGGMDVHWPFVGRPRSVLTNNVPMRDFDARGCHLPGDFRGIVEVNLPGDH